MTVYVVVDTAILGRVVGVSARPQGAEVIRADEARFLAADCSGRIAETVYRRFYERMQIQTHRVKDTE